MNAPSSAPHSAAPTTTRGLLKGLLVALFLVTSLLTLLSLESPPARVELPRLEPSPQRLDQPARP